MDLYLESHMRNMDGVWFIDLLLQRQLLGRHPRWKVNPTKLKSERNLEKPAWNPKKFGKEAGSFGDSLHELIILGCFLENVLRAFHRSSGVHTLTGDSLASWSLGMRCVCSPTHPIARRCFSTPPIEYFLTGAHGQGKSGACEILL